MPALEAAMNGDGIAQRGPLLVVLPPHQNNFGMWLRVERWNGEPPDDLDGWEEGFAACVEVEEQGLVHYDSPTTHGAEFEVPPGRYTIRVTGRDFVARGWPGTTTPGTSGGSSCGPATSPRHLSNCCAGPRSPDRFTGERPT
jgi:hypothetical protein